MSTLKIDIKKIKQNLSILKSKLNHIHLIFIVKVLNGNTEILKHLIDEPDVFAFGDSKLSTLKWIKKNSHAQKTILIKPPSSQELSDVIEYCDYSHACNVDMIRELNSLSKKKKVKQKIFILIEMGDCREGFYRTNLKKRLSLVKRFKYIDVIGIGANFGCLTGKPPSLKDLEKLSEVHKKAESILNKKLILSSSASNSLPLLDSFPKSVDALRIGTAVFLGHCGIEFPLDYLNQDIFKFEVDILQRRNKEYLLNFGEVDVPYKYLDSPYKFIGSSSEMSVIRTTKNLDEISFNIRYYKALRSLMLSSIPKGIK